MKKTVWVLSCLVVAGLFLIQGLVVTGNKDSKFFYAGDFVYPAKVKKVIDQKCYACHSVKGKSEDARKALMWDNIPNLEKSKQVSVLSDIIEVIEEGSMPPKEVVKKNPEMKLPDEEKGILLTWAEAKADSLLK